MNILYGVNGEGYGHSTRSSEMAEYLQKKGHKIVIVSSGRGYDFLRKKFKCVEVTGLHFVFNDKCRIKKTHTFAYNLLNLPENLKDLKKINNLMKKFKPDLCITDFEPIVAFWAHRYKIPLISLDNEHQLTNLKIKIPKCHEADYLIAKSIVRGMIRRADYFLVISFKKAKSTRKNTFVVPPIIRKEVRNLKIGNSGKIVVYLSSPDSEVLKILKDTKEKFVVYGYNINKKEGNIEFKTREKFLSELKNCKAVIATAGFSSMSEAFFLKKPYLALPIYGQFEQFLNAYFLKQVGFGDYTERLTKEKLQYFLSKIRKYKKKLQEYKPDYNEVFRILNKIILEKQ